MCLGYKKICYIFLLLIAVFLLTSGVWAREYTDEQRQTSEKKIIRHVIMVTFDGVTEEDLEKSYTPNLNGLASSGIYAPGMDILPAETSYHLAALLSGADSEINGFNPEAKRLGVDILPGIFKKYGRDVFYVVARNSPAGNFLNVTRDSLPVRTAQGGDKEIMDTAIKQFEKSKPFFMGLVLSGAKNTPGFGARHYKAIGETDEQLGRLLSKLRTLGVYDESLIIVTGSNNKRTAGLQEDFKINRLLVPVVMTGPGLKSGAKLPPVRIIDVAPTAALLTAVAMPEDSNGIVIWDGLQTGGGFVEENLLQKRVQDLSREFMKSAGDVYQLQEEKRTVQAEKERIRKEKQEIQNIINRKDGKIRSLTGRIRAMQLTGLIILVLCGVGYVLEYKFLKKKFLMF